MCVLFVTILFGVTAYETQSSIDEDAPDICRDSAFADFDENLYKIDFEPWLTGGSV